MIGAVYLSRSLLMLNTLPLELLFMMESMAQTRDMFECSSMTLLRGPSSGLLSTARRLEIRVVQESRCALTGLVSP